MLHQVRIELRGGAGGEVVLRRPGSKRVQKIGTGANLEWTRINENRHRQVDVPSADVEICRSLGSNDCDGADTPI